jgi:hypothetical protein
MKPRRGKRAITKHRVRARLPKESITTSHYSPRRWWRYIARNVVLVREVKNPEKYLHASRRTRPHAS